jgi:hypothetical protein
MVEVIDAEHLIVVIIHRRLTAKRCYADAYTAIIASVTTTITALQTHSTCWQKRPRPCKKTLNPFTSCRGYCFVYGGGQKEKKEKGSVNVPIIVYPRAVCGTLLLPPPDVFDKNPYDDQHDSSKDSNKVHDVQLPPIRESISDTER